MKNIKEDVLEIYLETYIKDNEMQIEREKQADACMNSMCDHELYYADGRPAVKGDGSPDRRGNCPRAMSAYQEVLAHQYDSMVDLGDFFKAVGLV